MKIQQNNQNKMFIYLPKQTIDHLQLSKGDELDTKEYTSPEGKHKIILSKGLSVDDLPE